MSGHNSPRSIRPQWKYEQKGVYSSKFGIVKQVRHSRWAVCLPDRSLYPPALTRYAAMVAAEREQEK